MLLLDLPPGTGDVAISVAQLIPGAEILVVTTPQLAAAEVAERAGAIALQTRQRIVGVVENMSGLLLPDGSTMQIFGEGGGRQVAERLSRAVGADVPLLGQVPLDPALVSAGDSGVPLVLSAPDSAAGKELRSIADALSARKRGLAGMSLGPGSLGPLTPLRRDRRFGASHSHFRAQTYVWALGGVFVERSVLGRRRGGGAAGGGCSACRTCR